jgi:chromosome segregation ATPase
MPRDPQEINNEYVTLCQGIGHRTAVLQRVENELKQFKAKVQKLEVEMQQAEDLAKAMAAKAAANTKKVVGEVIDAAKKAVGGEVIPIQTAAPPAAEAAVSEPAPTPAASESGGV